MSAPRHLAPRAIDGTPRVKCAKPYRGPCPRCFPQAYTLHARHRAVTA